MPNFDKTGPAGQGPLTGRGQGICVGKGSGFQNGFGRGFRGFARGMRRGMGNFFGQASEQISLKEQEKILEERLQAIRKERENGNMKK